MKNKNVLYTFAAIVAVGIIIAVSLGVVAGLGVAGYYHKNISMIEVTEKQASEIIITYGTVESCSRLGFIAKTSESDLENLVSRLTYKNKDGKLETVDMEKMAQKADEITDAFISDTQSNVMSPFSVGHGIMKVMCESKQHSAINIKKKFG